MEILKMRQRDPQSMSRKRVREESDPRNLAQTIASTQPPPTKQLVLEHQSRFKSEVSDIICLSCHVRDSITTPL